MIERKPRENFSLIAPVGSFPSEAWLAAVLSVAGRYSGTMPSGWVYQNGASLYKNNSAKWAPQTWLASYGGIGRVPLTVGTGNSIAFYGRIDYVNNNILYRLYVYNSWFQWDNDIPSVYTWQHSAPDNGFLVGTQQVTDGQNTYLVRHFQFGVESNQVITGLDWRVTTADTFYYYNNQWRYLPGYSLRGDTSYITWIEGDGLFHVGDIPYPGVNKYLTSSYTVTWRWTGTTIGDNVLLWSDEGTISNSRKPFQ